MFKKLLCALMGLGCLSQSAWALPGDSREGMIQALKHHPLFPAAHFSTKTGEVGPIKSFEVLPDKHLLAFSAFYNVHLDQAKTIQYEQVSLLNQVDGVKCAAELDLEAYYDSILSDLPYPTLLRKCTAGAAVDFQSKDARGFKALELAYSKLSPVIADFRAARLHKQARQYFYIDFDEKQGKLFRYRLPDGPIPFAVYLGAKFNYIASPNALVVLKKNESFKQIFAKWDQDARLWQRIQPQSPKAP